MWKLALALLVACNLDVTSPGPDATTIHLITTPDASCHEAGQNNCCTLLPDSDSARACFASELRDGTCAELVCSCGVIAACHVSGS